MSSLANGRYNKVVSSMKCPRQIFSLMVGATWAPNGAVSVGIPTGQVGAENEGPPDSKLAAADGVVNASSDSDAGLIITGSWYSPASASGYRL